MRRATWFLPLAVVLGAPAAFPQGVPVGPEFRLNTYATSTQTFPAVTADSSGNLVAVWESNDQDGFNWGIYGQRYADSGAPLGSEFRVNTTTFLSQRNPAVASDAAGNFVVVWHSEQDGSEYGIFGQRYAGSGEPLGPEFRVNTFTLNDQFYATVAMDPAGNFVVVWGGDLQDGSEHAVLGQRFASSGAPLGPEFVVNSYTPGDQRAPSVASDASGNFIVVWHSDAQDGSADGVFGQRYASSGTPLGPEFRVNTYSTNEQFYPAVASSPSGDFIVVWTSSAPDGSAYDFFGQRFDSSGASLGTEFRANTETIGSQWFGSVASDLSGNFVVVWSGDTPRASGYDVLAQRYDSSGVPQGPEFRVNTYTTQFQDQPVVAASMGNFIVVWASYHQDAFPGSGVYGQRFSPIVPVELMGLGVE